MTIERTNPAGLADCMQALARARLGVGRSGNASQRTVRGLRITPTGIEPDGLREDAMVELSLGGERLAGTLLPSSEWRMHAEIYRARPEVNAVVHCHSRHATALACCGRGIPAFHYMVAVAGGDSIRCAPYELFGTQELALGALAALEGRRACLLANHGQLTLGHTLDAALALAVEVEELAAQYMAALALGDVQLLDDTQMRAVIERFAGYGQQP